MVSKPNPDFTHATLRMYSKTLFLLNRILLPRSPTDFNQITLRKESNLVTLPLINHYIKR